MTRSATIGVWCLLFLAYLAVAAFAETAEKDPDAKHSCAAVDPCVAELIKTCSASDAPVHPPLDPEAWQSLARVTALALLLWFLKEIAQGLFKRGQDKAKKDPELARLVAERLLQLAVAGDSKVTANSVDALKQLNSRVDEVSRVMTQRFDEMHAEIDRAITEALSQKPKS